MAKKKRKISPEASSRSEMYKDVTSFHKLKDKFSYVKYAVGVLVIITVFALVFVSYPAKCPAGFSAMRTPEFIHDKYAHWESPYVAEGQYKGRALSLVDNGDGTFTGYNKADPLNRDNFVAGTKNCFKLDGSFTETELSFWTTNPWGVNSAGSGKITKLYHSAPKGSTSFEH